MSFALLYGVCLAVSIGAPLRDVHAQGIPTPVTWTAQPVPAQVPVGGMVRVRVSATIDTGWKVYALDSPAGRPLSIRLEALPEGLAQEGGLVQSTPKQGYDPNFQAEVRYFETTARVDVPVRVAATRAPGPVTLRGGVSYIVCNAEVCLPPRTEPFAVEVTVTEAPAGAANTPDGTALGAPSALQPDGAGPSEAATMGSQPPPALVSANQPASPDTARSLASLPPADSGSASQVPSGLSTPVNTSAEGRGFGRSSRGEGGLLTFLLLAIGAGLGALLMPCVFPMIPLTVAYFTRHADSPRAAHRMAFAFGASIVVLFTGLGLAMALLLGAAGAQTVAANPFVNLMLGLMLAAFGLSLVGLFELRLPARLVNAVDRKGRQAQGLGGVVFMGLTLALTSFACTAPFV
ncbi:MAG TPA: cytochrome c biogenesis protein CcdA, partial [Rhodothermales bacterium]|nr:cytochrome c biogenesis protein CcdA [Rhodothermales bacterium]